MNFELIALEESKAEPPNPIWNKLSYKLEENGGVGAPVWEKMLDLDTIADPPCSSEPKSQCEECGGTGAVELFSSAVPCSRRCKP